MNTNKIKTAVLLGMALLGIGFPVAVALSNAPAQTAPVAVEASAPKGEVEFGAVTVVNEEPGTAIEIAPAPKATHHAKRTTAKADRDCRRLTLDQEGRPGARQVWYCEGAI